MAKAKKEKDKMSPSDFMGKCTWEGGQIHEGFEYGLTPNDLDDSNPEFKKLLSKCHKAYLAYAKLLEEANEMLEEITDQEWE